MPLVGAPGRRCPGPAVAREHVSFGASAEALQGKPQGEAGKLPGVNRLLLPPHFRPGDWFNRIDWTAASHGFGSGLPVSTKNGGSWSYMGPLLREAGRLAPTTAHIKTATAVFQVCVRLWLC